MKEAVYNQDKISSECRSPKSANPVKNTILKIVLSLAVMILFPAVLEFGLRLGGYGEASAFFIDSPNPEMNGWVDNSGFTVPFFSRSLERTPAPNDVPKEKAANEMRIVVLGASAAMGDPMPEFGLPRVLQALIERSATGKTVRVINAAITAINSHVVRVLARDCLKIEPDAIVIYLGNNEIVGPFGPGTIFSGFYKNRFWIKAATFVRRTRIGQLLANLRDTLVRHEGIPSEWGGMGMFLASTFSEDDPDVITARKHFKANLEEVISLFAEHGIPVVLSTVAVNTDDFPPLLAIENDDAYEKGKAAEERGDRGAAWVLFQKACDADLLRFRADSGINEAIRDTSGRHAEVIPVDAAGSFRDMYMNGASGADLFVDHVHFTFTGNYLLAQLIANALTPLLSLDPDALAAVSEFACRDRLAFSPWAETELWQKMKSRFLQPPFSHQPGHDERFRRAWIAKQNVELMKSQNDLSQWIATISGNLRAHPDDADLLLWRGRAYMQEKKITDAQGDFQAAARLWPHRETPRGLNAFTETIMYGSAAAINHFKRSWAGSGRHMLSVIHYVGVMLRDNGRYEDAAAWFRAGTEIDADSPGMLTQLGYATLSLGKAGEAIPTFEQALRLNPRDKVARSYLGVSFGMQDFWRKGLQNLREAVELDPDDPELRYNYAFGLKQDGKDKDAAREFDLLLEQNPADIDAARDYMDILWKTNDLPKAASVCARARMYYPDQSSLLLRSAMIKAKSGEVDGALNILTQIQPAGTANHQKLVLSLSAWLEATRIGENPDDAAAMSAYLGRSTLSSMEPSPLMLIRPAVLQRLGRQQEAVQQLQAVRIFLQNPNESVAGYLQALKLAIERNVRFEVPVDIRADDPVLLELWNQL